MQKFSSFHGTIAFALAVGVNLVLQLVFSAILASGANTEIVQFAFMALVQASNFLIVFSLIKKTGSKPDFATLKPRITNVLTSGLLVIITIVGCFIATCWISYGLSELGVKASTINLEGTSLIFAIICTCVLAPIGEEAVYRYALLGGLKQKFSAPIAVLLSALAFSLMHLSPHQTFYQFFLGIALGMVEVKTGNTLLCVIMHAISNAFVICLSFLPQIEAVVLSQPWFIAVAIALLVCGAVAFCFVTKLLKIEHTFEVKRDQKEENNNAMAVYILIIGLCALIWSLGFFA